MRLSKDYYNNGSPDPIPVFVDIWSMHIREATKCAQGSELIKLQQRVSVYPRNCKKLSLEKRQRI